jgi:CBS domain containing-hemolysin-like protein
VQQLFGIEFPEPAMDTATTIAGLLNGVAGHVPLPGEHIEYDGLRFEVMEANQRKVLRLRVRPRVAAVPATP